ncbi:hypothetical protein C1882_08025 [Pseudomonas sp. FW305-E2]|nr:hypothetical protein C1882_08025 [Pseudomonas sp. FW305-E2]
MKGAVSYLKLGLDQNLPNEWRLCRALRGQTRAYRYDTGFGCGAVIVGAGLPAKRPAQTKEIQQAIDLSRQMPKAQLFQRLQRIKSLFFLAKNPATQRLTLAKCRLRWEPLRPRRRPLPCNPLRLGTGFISIFGPDGVRLMA